MQKCPAIAVLLLCFALFGCERNSSEASFEIYQQRLASVLEVPTPAAPKTQTPPLPDIRDLLLPIEEIRIGLLDAYELRKCGLFQLIAERNSTLGKLQDKTRQMRYELLFMDGLEYCLSTLPEDSELRPQLEQFHALKRRQLPHYLWNMLTTGEEWRRQLNLFTHAFPLDSFPGATENQEAMRYLQHIHQRIIREETLPPKQAEGLLHHQAAIHTFRYFGQLVYSMARASDWLNTTTRLLEAHESAVICGANRNQQQAEYLSNVFYRFFAADLQPYLTELDSQYQQIQGPLRTLLNPPTELGPRFAPYYDYYVAGQLYQDYRQAILNHVRFWQRTFKRCQIKVGLQHQSN
ncbi:DUF3080 domain-containing protein [Photobacterium sp. TY1-4]|uniref:DUF3080 domain-containing protein n=1 Tax=Photobacterium sp. TY1-4 TaxID=2899122 RepID=UPI0021BE7926|nr:DUF3080 domain-containing protein [Photobacterium sp. TY1-4]UXI00070.1 DUF3080 domain-containing protein [Photobacterium sp. TY1-4]